MKDKPDMDRAKTKFEEMLPAEIVAQIKGVSIAYLPVGSMEWHGPHMAMGMDTAHAYAVAQGLAERLGGAVLPPLYIGTERPRSSETLKKIGFTGSEEIVGMDFPNNSVKSMYWPEELFRAIITQQVAFLCEAGFQTVVIVNGHGADNQIAALNELADALSRRTGARVLAQFVLSGGCGVGVGHAGLLETSVMMATVPDGVDLSALPPKPRKLKNVDFAVVDSETFTKGGNEDFTVRYDPRDASADTGRRIIDFEVDRCAKALADSMERSLHHK